MRIGSHNTMTYLPPKRFYMRLFNIVAKCQDLDIDEQFNHGVRTFDLRILYDKHHKPYFAHGLVTYKGIEVATILHKINNFKNCTVRIVLESEKHQGTTLFALDVNKWIRTYKNIEFIQGNSKKNWRKLINLKDFDGEQLVSSMRGKGLLRIFPRLYAIIKNKKHRTLYKYTNKTYLMDFIGKY